MQAIFFDTVADFRTWLNQNQATETEIWVGLYKKASGRQVMSRDEILDEALCFGWGESRIKNINAVSYGLRLSPRKRGSKWSSKNIAKARQLIELGLMEISGQTSFDTRDKSQDNYDKKIEKLSPEYETALRQNSDAWDYFDCASPSYKKIATQWIMQAKREETRQKRLQVLIESSEKGEKIPILAS